MSDDGEGSSYDVRGRIRRSNVSNKKTQQLSALEALKAARLKGSSYRARVVEDENLYEEVDDEEYAAKKREERAFIEGDDGEYVSDESDDFEENSVDLKQSKVKEEKKAKRGTLTHFLQVKKKHAENTVNLEDDPILNECLAKLENENGDDDATTNEEISKEMENKNEPISFFASNWDDTDSKISGLNPYARSSSKRLASPTTLSSNMSEIKLRRIARTEEDEKKFNDSLLEISQNVKECRENFANEKLPFLHVEQRGENQKQRAYCTELPKEQTKRLVEEKEQTSQIQSKDDDVDVFFASGDVEMEKEEESDRNDPEPILGDKVIRFYYLDAFEDTMKKPGTVYLFGRIKGVESLNYESCCIVVKNISRQIFFLKRDYNLQTGAEVSDDDLRNEVREVLQRKFSVTKYKSMMISKRFLSRELPLFDDKLYALEVHFNANYGRIPSDFCGNTFSRVLNTTTTSMERIVVDQEIKGPCWLDISGAEKVDNGVSFCKNEFILDAENVSLRKHIKTAIGKFSIPTVRLMALNIMTALNRDENEQQIVLISMVYDNSFVIDGPYLNTKKLNRFCLITKKLGKNNVVLPYDLPNKLKFMNMKESVKEAANERNLLCAFLSKISLMDPDMIVAHDWSTQLALLVSRMEKCHCKDLYLISRLNRPMKQVGRGKFAQWELTAGRLFVDSKTSAEELVRSRSYTMEDLVQQILKPIDPSVKRLHLGLEQITETFSLFTPKLDILDLIKWNLSEAFLSLRIIVQLNAIPLFLQITQIVGGILSRTLLGGRAERNEFLLLHACAKNKIVAPDKHIYLKEGKGTKATTAQKLVNESPTDMNTVEEVENDALTKTKKDNPAHKKSQYTGGLVLEPKKGLYETFIVLLDFNSLYPSIIQEFNICFTTVPNAFADVNETELPVMPGESKSDGLLKTEIRELVNRRKEVKNLMKRADINSPAYKQYNIRQMGLKLTANSMYGCLGFAQSRFYAKTLAAMVTSKGREVLMHTRDLVQAEGFSVIYGDTDSIMVNTNSTNMEHTKAVAQKLKQIVNKNYRLLELDVDGIYKKLLLLKKKKYAGLAVDLNNESIVTRELKGLDIVRRDWSLLAKEIGDKIVDLILSTAERDEIVENIRQLLSTLRKNLDNGLVDNSKFEIFKQLTKNPSAYHDAKSQPHVLVAMRLNATKKFCFKQGDVIKYVICKDGTNNSSTQRAYHLTELNDADDLSIDVNYYLTQQVHPVVSRLCEPMEEIDAVQIAESLGVDSSSYRRAAAALQNVPAEEDDVQFGLEQDFDNCEGFTYECFQCKHLNIIRSILADENSSKDYRFSLEKCAQCSTSLIHDQLNGILKRLFVLLRQYVEKCMQSPFLCDDVTCSAECVLPSVEQWTNEGCVCFKCHQGIMKKTYSCKRLFDQQCFLKSIFDVDAFLGGKLSKDKKQSLISREDFDTISQAYRKCLLIVERFLSFNDFNKVDLGIVFAPLFPAKLHFKN